MWQIIFGSFLFLSLIAFFLNAYFYDKLLKIQYKRFPLDWIKDDKPIGAFFIPPGASLFWGSLSRRRTFRTWLFNKPIWINKDEEAERIYKLFRVTGLISLLIIILFVITLIVIFLNQS